MYSQLVDTRWLSSHHQIIYTYLNTCTPALYIYLLMQLYLYYTYTYMNKCLLRMTSTNHSNDMYVWKRSILTWWGSCNTDEVVWLYAFSKFLIQWSHTIILSFHGQHGQVCRHFKSCFDKFYIFIVWNVIWWPSVKVNAGLEGVFITCFSRLKGLYNSYGQPVL